MMPVGCCKNADAEHHLSQNSECGFVGYSSYTRLKNNNDNEEERKSFASIYNLLIFFSIQSTSFTFIKSKASGAKIKLTLEHHETDENF